MKKIAKVLSPVAMIKSMTDTPKMPQPTAPKVMPMSDDEATKQARRRSIASQTARRGRASTMLSQSAGENLG